MKAAVWILLAVILMAASPDWEWSTNRTTVYRSDGQELLVDDDGELVQVERAHYAVHEGNYYTCSVRDGDVDTDTLFVGFSSPSDVDIHFASNVTSSVAGVWYLYENPTLQDTSGYVSYGYIRNNNRQSSNTSGATVWYGEDDIGIDAASVGTLLVESSFGVAGGHPASATGGVRETVNEWLLKRSEDYLLLFISAADNANVTFTIAFYEE